MEIISSYREGTNPFEIVQDDAGTTVYVAIHRYPRMSDPSKPGFELLAETTGRSAAVQALFVEGMEFPPGEDNLPVYVERVKEVAAAVIALSHAADEQTAE